jgi:thioredoxin
MKSAQLILGIGLSLLPLFSCNSQPKDQKTQPETKEITPPQIEHLTAAVFKQKVFNYETNKTWKYAGDKPAIIDFYADWCGPCKVIAPTIAQIADEYKGKINVYKVNVDNEKEIAGAFGISGIPAILFIPMSEQPQMSTGVINREAFDKAIKEVLKIN